MSNDFRALFDLPREVTYLNCAYMGPLPTASVEAGMASYRAKARPWTVKAPDDFFSGPDTLRDEAARLFGGSAEHVALVPAASYGLATAARNLKPAKGSEILVLKDQFPSNVYTWRVLAQRSGATLRTAARSGNQSWTDAVLDAIGPQTSVLALPQVHWADGGSLDLEAIAGAARQQGAALVLDLTQSLGAKPFNVKTIDPDFAVSACYKWLLGPYTMGVMHIAKRHLSGVPLEENWIAREGSQDFARLVDYADGYAPGARRFDMGERSGFQLVPAAVESIRLLNRVGVETVARTLAETTRALADSVRDLGVKDDVPDRADHYLCLGLPDGAPRDLAARLGKHNVHVSQRGDRLRVTPHLYNDAGDITRFADAMKAALS
jgi:selenocysteine lyase/cysteine desulfurase